MYDVIDPEEPGHTVPSRLALRGQRPGPADIAAAARCRLRHETVDGRYVGREGRSYVALADLYGRIAVDPDVVVTRAVRADDERLTGNGRFVIFDDGLSLDHAERLRPPDHRDDVVHIWHPIGVRSIVSSSLGVEVESLDADDATTLTPDQLADLIACLAAAQDDQRCRFGRGVEGDPVAGAGA